MFKLFEDIERISSRNGKIDLLATADALQIKLLEACYNPYKQYHIRKWYIPVVCGDFNNIAAVTSFFKLLNELRESNRSSALESLVYEFMCLCTEQQQKWFTLIIKKDLKIGANTKSINKALGNIIPTFEVMLASRKGNGTVSEFSLEGKNWIIQPKLDGFRAVLQMWDGVFVGRSGKELPNVNLDEKIKPYIGEDYVLDGELYSNEISFQALSSILRSDNKPIPDHIKFVVWDIIPKDIWLKQDTINTEPYKKRYNHFSVFCKKWPDGFIDAISYTFYYWEIDNKFHSYYIGNPNLKSLQEIYSFYLEKGYEGIMMKDCDVGYEWKRSRTGLFKIKPEETCDAIVIGLYEGTGKYKNMLGGLSVETEDEITVQVGGGFSDAERKDLWENPIKDGTWIEMKYTEKSYAKGSKIPTGLRHPRFVRIRDDK